MKPGPPPYTSAKLRLLGATRAYEQRRDTTSSDFQEEPPAELSPHARSAWCDIVSKLKDARLIGDLDRALLVRYCEMHAEWRLATDHIREHGPIEDTPWGMRRSAASRIASDLSQKMLCLEREMGMTPSSRARLENPPDPLEEAEDFSVSKPEPLREKKA